MTIDFCDHFWGERNNGFDVLYHNMKYGQVASKELVEFFRERLSIEETLSKLSGKLAKQASGNCVHGTFAPLWQVLKSSSERQTTLHLQMVQKFQELIKDVAKYNEAQHKNHRNVKDSESRTLEIVQSIQSTAITLTKAKDLYNQRCVEYDKLKRDNASAKEVEKAELKFHKACDDYKHLVEKYSVVRDEFERKMLSSCRHFQDLEEAHLKQMKNFLQTYSEVLLSGHDAIGMIYSEFGHKFAEATVDKLLEQFVQSKATGTERPAFATDCNRYQQGPIRFEEADVSGSPTSANVVPSPDLSSTGSECYSGNLSIANPANLISPLSLNGDRTTVTVTAATTPTTLASVTPTNKKEGNKNEPQTQQQSAGRKSKSSSRTSSLLNLFLPSHGQVRMEPDRPNSPENGDKWITARATMTTTVDNDAVHEINGIVTNEKTPDGSGGVFGRNTFRGSKSPVEALRNIRWTTGLWKSKAGGKKEKKLKKNKKGNDTSNKDDKIDSDENNSGLKEEPSPIDSHNMDIPEVDEEGYSVRPKFDSKNNRGSFYSSSDSDSEEEKERKIHIEIKPLTNGSAPLSASIDELRASVGNFALAPLGQNSSRRSPCGELDIQFKRSISASQQMNKPGSSVGGDLLSLCSAQSPTTSSASTPTGVGGVGGYGFLPSPADTTEVQSPSASLGQRSTGTTPTPTRSEELGDLFAEMGDLPPALPPKHGQPQPQQQSISRGSTPVGPPLLPRPPSRRAGEGVPSRGRMSPISAVGAVTLSSNGSISRADSLGSLSSAEFRTSSMSVGSSRGPSPLTIGMSDIVPIAVAFQEIAHAYFKGTEESRCQVRLTGDMMISFPAGIVQVLANNPSPAALVFRLKKGVRLDSVTPNRQLVIQDENQSSPGSYVYEFNMAALTTILRRQAEQNPTASYFNVDILKYQVKSAPGAQSTPLHLVAYWKCESKFTDLRLDYKYNGTALAAPSPLLNIAIHVPVDGGVTSLQSKPAGQWVSEAHRALWRFTELSQHSDDEGTGSLRARFDLSDGPSSPGTIAAQFSCEGTTLSGADFELVGLGYRVSLVKRRVITGKYICETDVDMRYRYAPPPV